ncbi:UDP-glycosyltransferase [Actinidia chinensis var. chinensis]|uniref:Glycosyltransferase n=1 Tax=Actinidia chinensis var. chinensis TaxID=1590841 RepID=A0A2R6Q9P6_ACTCC|nr:UDP-glycosyltransferase [Actinidia chinensis var. chinensis]
MASSQTQNQQQLQLHFVIVPLMSQSHLIPMTDFAKLLARRPGLTVTIITTPLNAVRYQPVIDRANKGGLGIRLIPLPFPGREAGLPPNCENMDSLASPDLVENFFEATSMLQHPLQKLLAHLHPPPSCIITSNALPWTSKVATKFRIPRYVFNALSCFTLLCSKLVEESPKNSESVSISVRDMRIEFPKAQLPESMRRNADKLNGMLDQMKEAKRSAQGVLVNSLEEMEPEIVEEYKKVAKENIWCIGPVSLCNREISDQFHRGNKAAMDEQDCLKWLDSKKSGSVLYACFGSLCHISSPQLIEIGLGLEASNQPFIWIIRGVDCSEEIEKWLKEERFEERTGERGLVIRGWAPQVLILSHPAVGGFLTHCGWNSTLEGVCAGVPMITWPMFAEQFYNEKLVTQVLRIGVRVGVENGMVWGEEEKVLVKRERVKKAIEEVMMDGEECEERRKRAREFAKMAKKAIEEGGSSYLNITYLIEDVIQHVMN